MTHNHHPPKPDLQDYQRALESMDTLVDIFAEEVMTVAERAQHFASLRQAGSSRVSSFMSQPVRSVHQASSLAEAAELLVNERISGLPVVNESGVLIGIITEADFLRGVGLPSHQPSFTVWQTLEAMLDHLLRGTTVDGPEDAVADHMQRKVVCAAVDDDIECIVELMKQHRITRVVICDDRRHPVGMVTRSDLVRIFFARFLPPATGQ